MRVVEGTQQSFTLKFLEEDGTPTYPYDDVGGPSVTFYDTDMDIIDRRNATPTTVTGEWQVDFSIPNFNLIDEIDLDIVWEMYDEGCNRVSKTITVTVLPEKNKRYGDIVTVIKKSDTKFTFVLERTVEANDSVLMTISLNNEIIAEDIDLMSDPTIEKTITKTRAVFEVPLGADTASLRLEPISVLVIHTDKRKVPDIVQSNLWVITNQIMVAVSMLQQSIDKAKLENVIPELEFTTADYLLYLYRGLQMFNSYPPLVTSIRGTNMQGVLLHLWIVCSSLEALKAQTLAEGASAFDFSGQTVNLNVDRTPSLEAAIGRLESQIENEVKPYKKLLGKASIIDNDGSIGSKSLASAIARNFGRTSIINSPTTKFRRTSGFWINTRLNR
jgi:hypothetical protein